MASPTYYASVVASVAGANKRHLTIWNGHASVIIRVYSVRVASATTGTVAGQIIPLYVARISTAPTGGSAGVIVKADSNNANVPASITCTIADTGGANELGPIGCGVVSGEETSSANGDMLFESIIDGSQPLVLRQDEGIVIKQGALASAGAITIVIKLGAA